jgi:hypothetical protein
MISLSRRRRERPPEPLIDGLSSSFSATAPESESTHDQISAERKGSTGHAPSFYESELLRNVPSLSPCPGTLFKHDRGPRKFVDQKGVGFVSVSFAAEISNIHWRRCRYFPNLSGSFFHAHIANGLHHDRGDAK